jgi:hypothetical protein
MARLVSTAIPHKNHSNFLMLPVLTLEAHNPLTQSDNHNNHNQIDHNASWIYIDRA